MRSTHAIRADYPLAGSEDGLPVEITFAYTPVRGLQPDIDFQSVRPADRLPNPLPLVIRSAIESWAREWLDDDDGYNRAWDVAVDDIERQRESARDMGVRV